MSKINTITTTGLFHLSDKAQLTNDILTPTKKWFSLGQNQLDGTFIPLPKNPTTNQERGWWSQNFSNPNMLFNPRPSITGTVTPQPAFFLNITGDELTNNFPVDMNITFYSTDGTALRTDQVRGNTDVNYHHIINLPEIAKFKIDFIKNNKANAELRILEINIVLEDEYIHYLMDDPNRRIYCRVFINYLDPFKDYKVTPDASSTFKHSLIDQTVNGIYEPDQKWFSLTDNRLDGSYHPMLDVPDPSVEVGWWSNAWSDSKGEFSTPPELIMNLTPQPVVGFKLVGDIKTNNYPIDFDIILYNNNKVIHTEEVRNNTNVVYTTRFIFPDIEKYIIKFYKTSIPYDQVKIVEFSSKFFEIYQGENLFSVDLLEEVGYDTGGLPLGNISSNELIVDIDDALHEFDLTRATAKYKGLLIRNRILTAEMGVELYKGYIKWYPFGTYYSSKWNVNNGDITAQVTGRDVLELLRQDEFLDTQIYTNKSMYDLFKFVLDSFPLLDLNYAIDNDLKNIIVPYAWFKPTTYRQCLARLADACLASVFVTRNNVIQVTLPKIIRDIDYSFKDSTSIFNRKYPSAFNGSVNSIRINGQSYKQSERKKLFTTSVTNTVLSNSRETFKIISTETPIVSLELNSIMFPSSLIVHSIKQTSWGILLDIENNTSSNVEFELKDVYGYVLQTDKKFERIYKNKTDIELNGIIEKSHSSDLIQNSDYAQQFAEGILRELNKSPMNIEIDTIGHVYINLLDSIKIRNQDDSGDPKYHISEIETHWDGALESTIKAEFL